MKKELISIQDLSRNRIGKIFALTKELKEKQRKGRAYRPLSGKTLALLFEKPSLRTRVTFETGMAQLGGQAVYLAPADINLGRRESVSDVARNLERWVQGIVARTFSHKTLTQLAESASIPVINGLTDLLHPCQALTDYYTILEKKGTLKGLKLAYIGDGNNVAHSLIYGAAKLGVNLTLATPREYKPARKILKGASPRIRLTNDPREAVKDADIIYTDVWVSMGQEAEREERLKAFKPYQVNRNLLKKAKKNPLIMHCLPAHRGEEITSGVIDSPNSIVFDQAENRLHLQKAILVLLLTGL
jgi:ornithine carbamoyltransferase